MPPSKKKRPSRSASLQELDRGLAYVRELAFGLANREVAAGRRATFPPSTGGQGARTAPRARRQQRTQQNVFVVYGRNRRIRDSMFEFLRCIGLEPLEWEQLIHLSGEGSPNVASLLEQGLARAKAIVVVLTPDDEARLRQEFLENYDPEHERQLTGQARPNVLFEAGMAFASAAANTIVVQIGNTRPFTDIGGRQMLRLTNEAGSREALIKRLQWIGCDVRTARTRWRTVGDFDS